MTQAFRPNGNGADFVAIADDSTNYLIALNKFTGSYGSALRVTNMDVGNVVYVNAGWDPENLAAIVPAVGTPGEGVAVMPGDTLIYLVDTTPQSNAAAQLYFAAAVTGTASVDISQGSVS
jgi:hypothetical protein